MNEQRSLGWRGGVLFGVGSIMAFQDWLGLDGYIQHLQSHWINLHWGVGVFMAFLGLFILLAKDEK